jgi:leader peptidase (prepilin peptidase)/N-methyltransferase
VKVIILVLASTVGLAVGSFLNVVLYRVPRGLSVVRPGSSCPRCGTLLAARHNVPVASWILLRGRCGTCKSRISPVYPLVEAVTGIAFLAVASLLLR